MSAQGVGSHEVRGDHISSSSSSLDTQHDSHSNDDKGNDECAESMLQRSPPLVRALNSSPEKSPSPQVSQQTVGNAPIVRGPPGRGFELNFVAETPQHDGQAGSVHSGGNTTAPSLNLNQGGHLSLQGLHAPPPPQAIWTTTCSLPIPPSLVGMMNPQANRSIMLNFGIDNLQPTRAFMMRGRDRGGGGDDSNNNNTIYYQLPSSNLPQDLHLDLSHAHISSANHPNSQIVLSSHGQLENGIGGPPLGMKQWTSRSPQRAESTQVLGQWSQTDGSNPSDGLPFSFAALLRTGDGGVPPGGNASTANQHELNGREYSSGSSKVDQLAHPPPANLQPSAPSWMIPPTTNIPRPNHPRPLMNSNYDPAYQAMGLPVDPHLRAFLAK